MLWSYHSFLPTFWTGFLIASFVISTQAMYFDLVQQKERCIIEEIPEDTLVTGYFLLEHWDKNHGTFSFLHCIQVLLMKRFGRYGKFTFTSHSSGQHFLCVKSNSTRFSVFKVHLDVQMGEHVIDPSAVKVKDTVKTMEYTMKHLINQIQYISKQQDFQREREETFRQMSEETNGNVLWWAIMQTSILLTVGFYQIRSLKNFLIEKKLV
uniref:GOLD domain-containing protein n=1 Tax=Electrophorus electricus TaxID=8005 RepID=A0A4W4GE68_ELEEL